MKLVLALALCSIASTALADQIIIPQDACFWRGQTYGELLYCESGEVAVGSCGSGKNDDCDTSRYTTSQNTIRVLTIPIIYRPVAPALVLPPSRIHLLRLPGLQG